MSKVKMADANASCTFRIISAIFFPSVSEAIQVRRPEPRTRTGFWRDFKSMPNLSVVRRGFAGGCRIQHMIGASFGVSESARSLSSAFVHQALLHRLIHSNLSEVTPTHRHDRHVVHWTPESDPSSRQRLAGIDLNSLPTQRPVSSGPVSGPIW